MLPFGNGKIMSNLRNAIVCVFDELKKIVFRNALISLITYIVCFLIFLQEGRAGYTPLHIAVEYNNVELAKFLLESSKQMNTETLCYRKVTAYQQAAEAGHIEMLHTLELFGCEVISPPESDIDDSDESIDGDSEY